MWVTGTVVEHSVVDDGELNACIVPDGTTMRNLEEDGLGRLIPREFTYTLDEINGFIRGGELRILAENEIVNSTGRLMQSGERYRSTNDENRRRTFEYYAEFKAFEAAEEEQYMRAAAAAAAARAEEEARLLQEQLDIAQAEEAEPETVITVDNYMDEIVYTLFMLMDMYKDFISNFESKEPEHKQRRQAQYTDSTQTNYATKEDMQKQKKILVDFLTTVISNPFFRNAKHAKLVELINQFVSQNEQKSGAVSVSPELEVEINKLLGVQVYFPRQMIDKLFPGNTDPDQIFTYFLRFLKFATNNRPRESFTHLRELSDEYKRQISGLVDIPALDKQLMAALEAYVVPKETMGWIEASSGVKKIPKTFGYLQNLQRLRLLSSIKTPGSLLDAAGIENDIVKLARASRKYGDFKLDRPVIKFLVKTMNGKTLANLFLRKQGPAYSLQINGFFGLNCNHFREGLVNAQDPTTGKISRQSVWDILISLFKGKFRYSGIEQSDPASFNHLDLCIKSNKTAMDMLKSFFAKKYSEEHPDEDLVSVYNDKNAARFMCSITQKGLVIFYSSITPKIEEEETEERVVIRDEFSNILFGEGVQEELNLQGSQCLDEHCETPPEEEPGDFKMDPPPPGFRRLRPGETGPSDGFMRVDFGSNDIKYLRKFLGKK